MSFWDELSRGFDRALEQFERDQRERRAQKYKRQMEKALAKRRKSERKNKSRP